jgi:hypothetical protein
LDVLTGIFELINYCLDQFCCCKTQEKKSAAKKIPDAIREIPKLDISKIKEETKEMPKL